jgi:predicted RNase H-like nuclease (RuvC/YqgF family)
MFPVIFQQIPSGPTIFLNPNCAARDALQQQQMTNLSFQITEQNQRLTHKINQNGELTRQNNELRDRIATLMDKNDDLRKQVNQEIQLTRQNDEVGDRVATLMDKNDDLRNRIATLTNQNAALEGKINTAEEKASLKREKLAKQNRNLIDKINKITKQFPFLTTANSRLRSQNAALKQINAYLTTQYDEATSHIAKIVALNSSLTDDKNKLTFELENKNTVIKKLKEKIIDLKIAHEDDRARKRRKMPRKEASSFGSTPQAAAIPTFPPLNGPFRNSLGSSLSTKEFETFLTDLNVPHDYLTQSFDES